MAAPIGYANLDVFVGINWVAEGVRLQGSRRIPGTPSIARALVANLDGTFRDAVLRALDVIHRMTPDQDGISYGQAGERFTLGRSQLRWRATSMSNQVEGWSNANLHSFPTAARPGQLLANDRRPRLLDGSGTDGPHDNSGRRRSAACSYPELGAPGQYRTLSPE